MPGNTNLPKTQGNDAENVIGGGDLECLWGTKARRNTIRGAPSAFPSQELPEATRPIPAGGKAKAMEERMLVYKIYQNEMDELIVEWKK